MRRAVPFAHKASRRRREYWFEPIRGRVGIERLIYSAMYHMNLIPILVIGIAVELAASERTDGYHEGAASDLFCKADKLSFVEFFGAVDREAPGWTAEHVRQHGHLSRVGSEMGMQMLYAKDFSHKASRQASAK